tara:strand:+ start:455879 stop:458716 length:2838 start_codon:yes stop_codon:yes gene_type:complete
MMSTMLTQLNTAWRLICTIALRELVSMFRVPAGWIIIALFAFLSAVLFVNQTLVPGQPGSMRYFFAASAWLLIPIAPAISMRLMSEEYRTGSFESLRTTPAGDWAVACGKYLGSTLFLALMLVPSLVYPIMLAMLSDPMPDPGPILAGYLMLLLVGSLYLGIGLLASSMTSSQTLAFLGTMMVLVLFMVVTSVLAPSAGKLSPILLKLSVISRAGEMGKGVIDSSTILFFVIGSVWMVALTAGVLEARRLASSRLSLIFFGSIFLLTTGTAAVFAGVLTNDHRFRFDVTSTSAHKLSPRATSMVNALTGETRIVLAINTTQTDQLALDLVSDVMETYDRASASLSAQMIDLSTQDGANRKASLIADLRDREASSIAKNSETLTQVAQVILRASQSLLAASPQLESIREAIDPASINGSTNRAFFQQRATLVRLGAQDLSTVAASLDGPQRVQGTQLIRSQLGQLEELRAQLDAFARAPEIAPVPRALSKSLGTKLSEIIDALSIAINRLDRLIPIDADRVELALETGEALLIIGPPDIGVAAVDLEALLPPTEVLESAGISPAGVIGPRAQELIASAIGQLVIKSHPIVVFVHAGNPGELLGASNLLTKAQNRFRQQGTQCIEWAPLHEPDRPSLTAMDPLNQRPVVYVILAADSAAGGGDTGITGARRATSLASVADQLLNEGQSVLISMNPSIFGSIGDPDPLVKALDPFGIVPDPTLTLLTQRLSGAKRNADPATILLPSVDTNETSTTHPIGSAMSGLSTVLPWSVPISIDPRVGTVTKPILTIPGTNELWGERDWLKLWSTPAQSRQYLSDQPMFDESKDIRRDQWIVAAGAERTRDQETQRVVVVGSNSWIYDAVTFSQGQLVDGRITTAFPGNLAMLESSIAWLAHLDDLIAPGIQARPIATISPLTPSQLSTYRLILLAGIPGLILVLGVGSRIVFG